MNKELKAMAKQYGFVLVRQRKHFVFKHCDGAIIVCSKTASDRRAFCNIRKEMERAVFMPASVI
jgi:predicted RNA binding protein YcfA (HicA-like mRNA interferase family)